MRLIPGREGLAINLVFERCYVCTLLLAGGTVLMLAARIVNYRLTKPRCHDLVERCT